jgi:hypothetical protein
MSIEDRQSDFVAFALRPDTRPEVPIEAQARQADPEGVAAIQQLIRGVMAVPAHGPEPEIAALLREAKKRYKNFQVALALRALRLEQGLRVAQKQIIQLQWELAQLRPRGTSPFCPEAQDD